MLAAPNFQAEVAQLVEQLIRNQQVTGSSPVFGSTVSRPVVFSMCGISGFELNRPYLSGLAGLWPAPGAR